LSDVIHETDTNRNETNTLAFEKDELGGREAISKDYAGFNNEILQITEEFDELIEKEQNALKFIEKFKEKI
jgi:hypothetical protein